MQNKIIGEIIMKKRSIGLSLTIVVLFMTAIGLAEEKAHWGYSGDEGPENWAKLDPKYSACSEGKNQSPV